MTDPLLWKSKQRGRVYLWRFAEGVRHFPGWHLSADPSGAASLVEVCNALIDTADRPAIVNIAVSPATMEVISVPGNVAGERSAVRASGFHIIAEHDDKPTFWELTETDGTVVLRLGLDQLARFREGVAGIPNGKGDFSIGGDDAAQDLWFWW